MKHLVYIITLATLTLTLVPIGQAVTVVYTPDEQQMIANAIDFGMFDQPGSWENFQERLRNDWRREGAVDRALNDPTFGAARELRGFLRGLSNPAY